MIRVVCPHCSKTLSIPEQYKGQWGKCNHCSGRVFVSEPDHGNPTSLSPRSVVPRTGMYRCTCCSGEPDSAKQRDLAKERELLRELGPEFALAFDAVRAAEQVAAENRRRLIMIVFFESGKPCTECPNCGSETRWTLIDEGEAAAARPGVKNPGFLGSLRGSWGSKPVAVAVESPPEHGTSTVESVLCDVCNESVFRPDGYLLTTSDIVRTPGFWKKYFATHKQEFAAMGVSSFGGFCANHRVSGPCLSDIARNRSPWMVCPDCVRVFDVNREQAHAHTLRWWESKRKFLPPGNGPAPITMVNLGR